MINETQPTSRNDATTGNLTRLLVPGQTQNHHRRRWRRTGRNRSAGHPHSDPVPQTEVLGVTVVTGDQWLKAEVAHTLRMLELIGRTDIPVVPGAEYPLVRRKEETELWEQRYGSIAWLGAWTPKYYFGGSVGRDVGGHAHRQAVRSGCRAFSGAHGPPVSSRGDDLRWRSHDQHRPS